MIFISHSTPQDDYFAAWLASKLIMLGYNVWLDLKDLSTGDSFNTVIKPKILAADVFLPLTTKSYSDKSNNQNTGVARELNCAATVDTQKLGHNYILPIKVDDIEYNNFPYHYIGWNAINFNCNWQEGLVKLVEELDKINIVRTQAINPLSLWFEAIHASNTILNKTEQYYTNWFKINLPDKIFIHTPEVFIKEEYYDLPFAIILEANHVITFANNAAMSEFTTIRETKEYAIADFSSLEDIFVSSVFILREPKKKLVKLLNKAMQEHMRSKGLICWKKNSNERVYYFNPSNIEKRISLKRYSKSRTTRSVTGSVSEEIKGEKVTVNWSFSLYAKAELQPYPHYRMFYSIVLSDENNKRFDEVLQHKFRRSVPSGWYNRKWFEILLAAMLKLSPTLESEHMEIPINKHEHFLVDNIPYNGYSLIGYKEP